MLMMTCMLMWLLMIFYKNDKKIIFYCVVISSLVIYVMTLNHTRAAMLMIFPFVALLMRQLLRFHKSQLASIPVPRSYLSQSHLFFRNPVSGSYQNTPNSGSYHFTPNSGSCQLKSYMIPSPISQLPCPHHFHHTSDAIS